MRLDYKEKLDKALASKLRQHLKKDPAMRRLTWKYYRWAMVGERTLYVDLFEWRSATTTVARATAWINTLAHDTAAISYGFEISGRRKKIVRPPRLWYAVLRNGRWKIGDKRFTTGTEKVDAVIAFKAMERE